MFGKWNAERFDGGIETQFKYHIIDFEDFLRKNLFELYDLRDK